MVDIKKNQGSKVSIRWATTPANYTKAGEGDMVTYAAKLYNMPETNISIEPSFVTNINGKETALNAETIENVRDINFQHNLFKQYMEENNIDMSLYDEIIKVDSRVNVLINYEFYEQGKKYVVKWARWDNFLSYGDGNFCDFTKLNGLVNVQGEPANKSGKSTFCYDVLHFLLFGKTRSGKAQNLGEYFNVYRPNVNEVKVEGCVCVDGIDYLIRRTLTRKKTVTQKVEYFQLVSDGTEEQLIEIPDALNLNEETTTKTSKIIRDAIGNENDFDLIISANAKDLDDLISTPKTERGRLLSRWMGLSILDDKNKKAKEIYNSEIKDKHIGGAFKVETLQTEIEQLTGGISELRNKIDKNKTNLLDCENNLIRLHNENDKLVESKRNVDSSLTHIDIQTLETKKKNIISEGIKLRDTIKVLKEKIESMGEIESVDDDAYEELLSEKGALSSEITQNERRIKILKKDNEDFKNAEYCKYCGAKLNNVDNSLIIGQNEKEIAELEKTNVEKRDKLTAITVKIDKISSIKSRRRELDNLTIKKEATERERENKLSEYNVVDGTLKKFKENEEAIRANNEIENKLNVIKANITTEENIKTRLVVENASFERDIENCEEKIKDKKALIVKIEEEKKEDRIWDTYLKIIGKDGIGKMALRNSLPLINAEIERLLSDVTDFQVEISVSDNDDVDFWLVRDNQKTRLSAASGLEKTQAALALRVALGKMCNLSQPPFILLDEILGSVAKENYDDMKVLYDRIIENYSFVLHICHIDLDWHNQTILITKDSDNISHLKIQL